jgi:hydroxymethylpyrimidine/phosphomethylpyrimidine kinase
MNPNPVALTIAGSDSGGGAGIQADLKTFQANGVFGTSAITCVTAQNPDGVTSIAEIPLQNIEKQILAVLDFFPIKVAKTGMLFTKEIIQMVTQIMQNRKFPLVVDPVMVATSGAKLLQDDAINSMQKELIPISDLVTPNADEASLLVGERVTRENMKEVTKVLFENFHVPILLKGGHLERNGTIVDILYDGKDYYEFETNYIFQKSTHGTGCTYSAAIAAQLAKSLPLQEAIRKAKEYLHKTIEQSLNVGRITTLNHNPK